MSIVALSLMEFSPSLSLACGKKVTLTAQLIISKLIYKRSALDPLDVLFCWKSSFLISLSVTFASSVALVGAEGDFRTVYEMFTESAFYDMIKDILSKQITKKIFSCLPWIRLAT